MTSPIHLRLDGDDVTVEAEQHGTHDALPCGFCTPGMLMAAPALLRANPVRRGRRPRRSWNAIQSSRWSTCWPGRPRPAASRPRTDPSSDNYQRPNRRHSMEILAVFLLFLAIFLVGMGRFVLGVLAAQSGAAQQPGHEPAPVLQRRLAAAREPTPE
jgi:hypothetical protein